MTNPCPTGHECHFSDTLLENADTIEALRAENEKLKNEIWDQTDQTQRFRDLAQERGRQINKLLNEVGKDALVKMCLRETLEIAARNEGGDYIQRALKALGE